MKTRILCAGTFDKLHTGHIQYLKSARKLSDNPYLIVIVARDKTSRAIKKKETINKEHYRLKKIKSLSFVDEAVLGYDKDNIIERVISLKPDIIALGYDQWAKEEWLKKKLKEKGFKIKINRMPKFPKRDIQ